MLCQECNRFRIGAVLSLVLPLFLILTPSLCRAQLASTATINGTVTDTSGAIVPDASITILNEATKSKTTTRSNTAGSFAVAGLAVGQYTISVSKQGFQTYVESGIALHPTQVATVNPVLKVGQVSTKISVVASAAQVQTSTSEISSHVSGQEAVTLPLNGRNYQSLAALMPGVINTSPDTALNQGARNTRNVMSVNGMGNDATLYTLDGIWNMNTGNMAQTTVTPNPDTIQEVRVLQNNYSAQYSLMGSSVVVLQTKSGTSTFHGGAYEYLRNDALDARNFFSPTVPPLKQNIFGYSVGGPVYIPHYYNTNRQKTFFYWSQQWVVQHIGSVLRGADPTQDMRNGIFTTPIIDPTTGQPFPQTSPGVYQIPQDRLNTNSLAILNAVAPLPNNPSGGFLNYLNLNPQINNQRDDEIKIDHNLTERLRLMGEYLDERQTAASPNLPALGSGNPFPTQHETDYTRNQLAQLRLTWTVTPTMTNTTSIAMNNNVLDLLISGTVLTSQVPDFKENLPYSGFGSDRLPYIQFSGGWANIGSPTSRPLNHASDLEDTFSDDWAWLRGSHYIQGGLDIVLGTKRQTAYAGASNGAWMFNGQFTGDPVADFLLGDAATFTQASTAPRYYAHYTIVSPYIQDQWKASRRLTLNIGLRVQFMPIPHDQPGYAASFDPSRYDPAKAPLVDSKGNITVTPNYNPLNGMIINGENGVPLNFTTAHEYFLAPMFGFAWDIFGNGKTALRGGYGITYTRIPFSTDCTSNCPLNPPRVQSINLSLPSFPNPIGAAASAQGIPSLYSLDPQYQPARVQTYSLSLQHQFRRNWVVSVAGAGNVARHLWQTWNINQPLPDAPYDYNPIINTGVTPYTYSPYLGYAGVSSFGSSGDSYWNALEVSVRHPMSRNLLMTAAYTWSHNLSHMVVDYYRPSAYYGNSTINTPQVMTLSWIYNLPWYQKASGWKGVGLGGWKYSTIFVAQSGFSLNPGLSIKNQGLAVLPNQLSSPTNGPKTVQEWFDTGAYTAPAAGYYGNATPGSIQGPGVVNFDMAFYKDFRFLESQDIEFRAEFFDIFNHTNFNGVETAYGNGNYGHITSARDPRIVEFALRYSF